MFNELKFKEMKNLEKVFVVLLREDLVVNVAAVFKSLKDAEQWVNLQKQDEENYYPNYMSYWIQEKEVE